MKRRFFPIIAAGLLILGAAAGHFLSLANPSKPVAAATTAAPTHQSAAQVITTSANSATISTTAIDAATEHAYTVASPSVVYVENVGVGTGSGIVYDSNGDIVTNYHVVTGATSLKVTLNDGRTFTAHVVGTDPADDLAVIKISASGLNPATFAGANGIHVAQMVLAIGSPLGLQQSVTSGLISGLNRVQQEPNGAYLPNAIQTSAPINPGNSGGALVSLSGAVVGMPTLEQTSTTDGTTAQGIGFAVPSTRITYIANQIISTGKVQNTGRPYLGIVPVDAASAQGGTGNGPFGGFGGGGNVIPATGALVQSLSSSGPAAKAGVQQGDVITSVDGTSIADANGLLTILSQHKPGDTISLTINRNGSNMTVHVRLGQLPG